MIYETLRLRSGFRQRAPASLTPARCLKLSKSAENGFGAASRAVLGNGHTLNCPNQILIIAHGEFAVCDSAHSGFVMKKVSGGIAETGTLAASHSSQRTR